MKNFINLLFAVFCFLNALVTNAQTSTAPSSGNGTAGNPYQIATLNNFYWLSQTSAQWVAGKYYIQTADIDASATSTWFSNGSGGYYGFPCIGGISGAVGNQVYGLSFSGNYDGQGFSISNLYINRTIHTVALFGLVGNATFRNMNLVNPIVLVSGGTATDYQGDAIFMANGAATLDNIHIIGGSLTNTSYFGYSGTMLGRVGAMTVTNCSTSASLIINCTSSGKLGGFVGAPTSAGSYTNCSSTGDVTTNGSYVGGFVGQISATGCTFSRCYSTGNVTGTYSAAGFAGTLYGGSITNCYATGNVTGPNSGGFSGYNLGPATVTNCYAKGSVTGTATGGFGSDAGAHTFSNCFWDNQTSGKAAAFGAGSNANVVGKTTVQMQTETTYTTALWDFVTETTNGTNDYWFIDATYNSGYPALVSNVRDWLGATSTTWTTTTNWRNGILPTAASIVRIIPGATYLPAIPSNLTLDRFSFNGVNHVFDLGSYNLICSQVLGFDANKYIKTSGTGLLKMNIANTRLLTFPTGNTSFDPVAITNNSGSADDFSVKVLDEVYLNGSNGTIVPNARVQRTWDISKTNANGGTGVNFNFNWNSGETSGTMPTTSLHHYSAGWSKQTGTTSSTSTSLTYTGYTGTFSPFAVADGTYTVLFASVLSLNAKKQPENVLLNWSANVEINATAYLVQHSSNGTNWNDIGAVTAAGNSTFAQYYTFKHQTPVLGINYYRIIQQDDNGPGTYSKVVSLMFSSQAGVSVYPNPVVNGKMNVQLDEGATIQLFDQSGMMVLSKALNKGVQQLDVTNLAKGMYLLKAGSERIKVSVQ